MNEKTDQMRVVVMGCGGSNGVPYAGNMWGECDPTNPKNERTRPSIYIEKNDTRIVIDTSPEFRQQFNKATSLKPLAQAEFSQHVNDPDPAMPAPLSGVLYTHHHSDHVNGIDDLRPLWFRGGKKPIPAYANQPTIDDLTARFPHIIQAPDPKYPGTLNLQPVSKDFLIGDLRVQSFDMYHYRDGTTLVTGYRIGDFGYTTDCTTMTEEALNVLKGVKVWVVGVFWCEGDFTHPSISEAMEWQKIIGAEQIFTTHMTARMDYDTYCKSMPKPMQPAYDGLEFIL